MSAFEAKKAREERAGIVKQITDLIVGAKKENRSLSADEQQAFDRLDASAEDLRVKAEGFERIEKAENLTLAESRQQIRTVSLSTPVATRQDQSNALKAWLSFNGDVKDEWMDSARRCNFNPASKTLRFSLPSYEMRAGQVEGTNSAGGYLVGTDNQLMQQIQRALKYYKGPREVSRVLRTERGDPLPYPLNSDVTNLGELTTENGTINEIDMTFSQVVFNAYKVDSGLVKVSWELLQDAYVDISEFIGESLGIRIGRELVVLETTGTGTGQQQGCVTGATLGATSAAAGAITYADLLNIYHAVDPAYRENATWMFTDTTYKYLRGLLDANNRPLLYSSLEGIAAGAGEVRELLGKPFIINQAMDSYSTTTGKAILFGDFNKGYLIRDVKDITLVRLDELLALTGQTGFIAWMRSDAKVTDAGMHPLQYLAMHA